MNLKTKQWINLKTPLQKFLTYGVRLEKLHTNSWNTKFNRMKKSKKDKQLENLLFEVYEKGVNNEDCDLTAYIEKVKKALTIVEGIATIQLKSIWNLNG